MSGTSAILPDELLARVSFHAVTRYIQRVVLGREIAVDPALLPKNPSKHGKFIAIAHCRAAGMTIEAVRALIMVPGVAAASLAGLSRCRTSAFEAVFEPTTGVVVTIQERRRRKKMRSKSVTTKAESHKHMNRFNRAERRRPSSRVGKQLA